MTVSLLSLLLLGWVWEGHPWKDGATFSSGIIFLVFLLDWFIFMNYKELKDIITDLIFAMMQISIPSPFNC